MERTANYMSVIKCSHCKVKLRIPGDRGCLEITCPNCGWIEELEAEEIRLKGGEELTQDTIKQIIRRRVKKIKDYTPRIGVFGVTGVGKSSLCNALFGADVAKISDVAAGTRAPQEVHLNAEDESSGITLIDFPGVGERTERDREYFELYRKFAPTLDLIIWVIKADDRAYSVSEKAYKEIIKPNIDRCPVVFVINQIDKLPPIREWNESEKKPGNNQEINIQKKITEIQLAFDVEKDNIIAVSVEENYNLPSIISRVMDVLPNEKKYSFAREAKEEFRTEEVISIANIGIWDYIKEFCGEVWDKNKEIIVSGLISGAVSFGKRLFKW